MGHIKVWIEEHPYLTGSFVLGVILLYFVLRGGSSSSAGSSTSTTATGASPALQAAQLQAGVQMQGIQAAAQDSANKVAGAVAVSQIQANADVTKAQLQYQENLQKIVTSGQVAFNTNDTALQTIQAQIGGQIQLASIGAGRDEQIAGIQADIAKHAQDTTYAENLLVAQAQQHQSDLGYAEHLLAYQGQQHQSDLNYAEHLLNAQTLQQQNSQYLDLIRSTHP